MGQDLPGGVLVPRGRRALRGLAVAHPLGRADQQAQGLGRRLDLQGVGVGVHPLRELDPEAVEALRHQLLRQLHRGAVPGLVPVVGDQHPPRAVAPEGIEVVRGEPLHPVRGG